MDFSRQKSKGNPGKCLYKALTTLGQSKNLCEFVKIAVFGDAIYLNFHESSKTFSVKKKSILSY